MAPNAEAAKESDNLTPGSFTRKDVKARPDIMIIGNEVYSAANFQHQHPGGSIFVSMFGGRDATEAFMEYHSRRSPRQRMAEHLVGTLSASEKATPVDEAYLELAKEVLAAVPNRGFAPPRYWAKLVLLLGATFWLEARLLLGERTLVGALVLGWLYGLVGLNIQHDANHGTLSRNGKINWAFGLFQDYIGGSSILWLQVCMHVRCMRLLAAGASTPRELVCLLSP